ncbi:MAG: hypothetical protein AB8F34_03325 [Akkermansiaceae bacterium]
MKRGVILVSVILAVSVSAGWYFKDQISPASNLITESKTANKANHKPDAKNYAQLKKQLSKERENLAKSYQMPPHKLDS